MAGVTYNYLACTCAAIFYFYLMFSFTDLSSYDHFGWRAVCKTNRWPDQQSDQVGEMKTNKIWHY